ncbi:MOSC domain-containing protein [Emticicia aquatilis]|uniref:MOSC domain-containing protein n=1 Tax=Emticicia aquatilis TaxID=1537369 RepID=A0A916YRD6_9BACT|nr:MOSC N-terminal beta barrel domain-containing protein [Emticicia aquatilis]GGD56008.1 MOSC domain-containing protein [Emticicia aquatilis]
MSFIVSEITIYPIKSLGGISLQEAIVEERGLKYDRRWVLADENNVFITQRQNEQMALIDVTIEEMGLRVTHRLKRIAPLQIPFEPQTVAGGVPHSEQITIWDDVVRGIRVSDEADAWFSTVLGKKSSLFYQPDDSIRLTDPKYSITKEEHTSFSDGYPILVIGQASLDELNAKLEEPVSMKRFRPNLVFTGGEAHVEDSWRYFTVGDAKLVGVKPCARCVLTTINPETAEKGKEPLRTLTQYRNVNNKILFGQNLLVVETGKISVGDELLMLENK